ncbi:hypothetical protein BH09BAC1_BH09BAC1_25680 [soil metagenome]
MKTARGIMMMVLLAIGAFAFTGCNTTKGLPQIHTDEGHDAQMGGGTGSGTIGDKPTAPSMDTP